jgi:hypothetical protein
MRVPVSTPAGMLTDSERSFSTRPAPPQALQGFLTIWPSPPQVGQVRSTVKKPCCARTLPMPEQVGQVTGSAPPSAPGAAQVSQATTGGHVDGLLDALEGLFQRDAQVVAQVRPALRPRPRPPPPPRPPMKSPNRSSNTSEKALAKSPCPGGENRRAGPPPPPPPMPPFEGRMAEAVIGGLLVGVLQRVIGLVHFLELGLGLGVVG